MFFTKKTKQQLLETFQKIGNDIGYNETNLINLKKDLNNRINTISDRITENEEITSNYLGSLTKKIEELEEDITQIEKNITQLEKRINTLSDYIQGPYTQQINENFMQINMQIQAILDEKINKKIEKKTMPNTTWKASKPKRIK